MTLEEFEELVWSFGASGCKVVEQYDERVKNAVAECWSRIQNELDEAYEKNIKLYLAGHYNDTKFTIIFDHRDLDGYSTGNGGMVNEWGDGTTANTDYAMKFDTEKEAQDWINEHKDEWNGTLTVC